MLFVSASVILTIIPAVVLGSCIWYDDRCYHDKKADVDKACPYFGEARKLKESSAVDYLTKHCSKMFQKKENEDLLTCCSAHQIKGLELIFQRLKEISGHCPACFSNIAHLFCGFTCGPNQHLFMKDPDIEQPTSSEEFENPLNPELEAILRKRHPKALVRPHDTCSAHSFITAVNEVRVDKATVEAIVASCVNVRYQGKPVFQQIFAAPMTAHSLLNYIGNPKQNKNVAVRLGFKAVSDGLPALNFSTYACNEIEPNSNKSCSCLDCLSSCKAEPLGKSALFGTMELSRATRLHFAENPNTAAIFVGAFSVVAAILLGLVLAFRYYSDKKHQNACRLTDVMVPGQLEASSMVSLIDHKKVKKPSGDVVFAASINESSLQRPFWQCLSDRYWAQNDYSTFGTRIPKGPVTSTPKPGISPNAG